MKCASVKQARAKSHPRGGQLPPWPHPSAKAFGFHPVLARTEPIALEGLKIALWLDEPSLTIDPEAKTVIVRFAERLAAIGVVVEPIRSPVAMTPMMFAYTTLLLAVVGAELPWLERAFHSLLRGPAIIARAMGAGPLSWAQAVLGFTARHREWLQANEARAHLETAARDVFALRHFACACCSRDRIPP